MSFKTDISFLRYLTIGAVGVRRAMQDLKDRGFQPIELERCCASNKIWDTKIKRLRLPDLLCIKTGVRFEVRAKTNLEIKMSHSPNNPDRFWHAGLRNEDIVCLIKCFDRPSGIVAATQPNYFSVGRLKEKAMLASDSQTKGQSEGFEKTIEWRSTVPTRDGTILEVTPDKLVALWDADPNRKARTQTYFLKGKKPYLKMGDNFRAFTTIIAGSPTSTADLAKCSTRIYKPISALISQNEVDRFAAAKALRFLSRPPREATKALESLISGEPDPRIALEASGTAAYLGSSLGEGRLSSFIWGDNVDSDLRMEAVLLLSELRGSHFARDQLRCVATNSRFAGLEMRRAAVWGLGKDGLQTYDDLVGFIDDTDEQVALHAIAAFSVDTPRPVVDWLVGDLIRGDLRRASAASKALSTIASDYAINALATAGAAQPPNDDWIIATLGLMPEAKVRQVVQCSHIINRLSPLFLLNDGSNWLADDAVSDDLRFLLRQTVE